MANVNAPFGLRPNVHQAGGCPNRLNEYEIASAYNTSIFSGDLVKSDATAGGRVINLAPDGTDARMLGVFAGCQYVDANGDVKFSQYWPANTTLATGTKCIAYVYDDPKLEFIAEITTVAATDVGAAFEWQNGTGNTANGRSGGYIDQAQTTTPQVKVEGLAPGIDGISLTEYGAFAKVRCSILTHEKSSTTTTF